MIKEYYVYLYRDEYNIPIYIGKGKDKRAWAHLVSKSKHHFVHKLQKMIRKGLNPKPEFLCKDIDEELAFFIEEEMIRRYGRLNFGTGSLLNLTDGGEGKSGPATGKGAKGVSRGSYIGKRAKGVPKTGNAAKGVPKTGKRAKGMLQGPATGKGAKGIPTTGNAAKGVPKTGGKARGMSGRGGSAKGMPNTGKAAKGISRPKLECSHCNKMYNAGNLKRWHGTNCKQYKSLTTIL